MNGFSAMSGKETLSVLASACAVIAFIASIAVSTFYAGIVYAGLFLGGALLGAFIDSIRMKRNDEDAIFEVLRGFSLAQLYIGAAITSGLLFGMAWDKLARNAWTASFGFAQWAGLILVFAGGLVFWQGWTLQLSRRHKKCPDCASKVLAEARKCKYCAYRFDTEEPL